MTLEEKQSAIDELTRKQKKLLKMARLIGKRKSGKNTDICTVIRRASNIVQIGMKVNSLQLQKHIIASKPLPKYEHGSFPCIVGIIREPEKLLIDGKWKLPKIAFMDSLDVD